MPQWLRRSGTPAWIEIGDLHRRPGADEVITVVDVRQPEALLAPPGHPPGAVNIPLTEIPTRAAELAESEQPIVLVCKTDRRSAKAVVRVARRSGVWSWTVALSMRRRRALMASAGTALTRRKTIHTSRFEVNRLCRQQLAT